MVMRRCMLGLYRLTAGRRILAHFDKLKRTQWLSRDELVALQHAKRQQLVDYAYKYVPYYRRTFAELGFHPDDLRRDPTSFQKLPLVTKEQIRKRADEFVTTHPAVRKTAVPRATSGSTGEPFSFWEDQRSLDTVTATFFWYFTWSGWQLGEPCALFWGQRQPKKSTWVRLRRRFTDYVFNVPITAHATVLSEQTWPTWRHESSVSSRE